ncbi:MAG: hypothetical protein IKO76_07235 [Butyrivibrio sp.]|nr:hypothetical protein [Butyrivibrio sp.]
MNKIFFGDKDLSEYGVVPSGSGTYSAPARKRTMESVPGRNGALTFEDDSFENISVKYPVGIRKPVGKHLDDCRNYLLSFSGYQRLEDTYHPEEFRLGVYEGGFEPAISVKGHIGTVDLTFNCKPQRFLKDGERDIEVTSGNELYNYTYFTALPLVRAYGTGTLAIGNQTIRINSANVYTDIDCDTMDAFKGASNCNGNIELLSGDFFKLKPGITGISFSGITRVIIRPRWWKI